MSKNFDKKTIIKKIEIERIAAHHQPQDKDGARYSILLTLNQGDDDYTVRSNCTDRINVIREVVDVLTDYFSV